MFNRILVPLDGSPLAERAIPHAMHIARIFGGSIILLHVLDPTPYRENIINVEPLNWQIRKTETDLYMQGIAERIRAQGVHAEHVLREGRPSENIVDFAQNENVDLLALTTHGAGGLTRWNTSSVISKVIEKAYMPVLVVRSYNYPAQNEPADASTAQPEPSKENGGAETAASGPAASEPAGSQSASNRPIQVPDPRTLAAARIPVTSATTGELEDSAIQYNRVLLPIDCSRRAECSLPSGIGIVEGEEKLRKAERESLSDPQETAGAGTPGGTPAPENPEPASTLLLAAVIRPPEIPIPAPYPEELQQLSDQFMKISRDAVNDYLSEIQARIPVKTENLIIENESISSAIHDLVEKEKVDLVILCAHGATGQPNWPYGSVARNYIEYGNQTVLVIQDVPRAQIRQTAAEIAAQKYGRR